MRNSNPVIAVLVALLQLNTNVSLPVDSATATDIKSAAQGGGGLEKVEGSAPNPLGLPVKAIDPGNKKMVEATGANIYSKGATTIDSKSAAQGVGASANAEGLGSIPLSLPVNPIGLGNKGIVELAGANMYTKGTATADNKSVAQGVSASTNAEGLGSTPLGLPMNTIGLGNKAMVEGADAGIYNKGASMIPNGSRDPGNPIGLPNSSYTMPNGAPVKSEGESTDELSELNDKLTKVDVEIKAHESKIRELEGSDESDSGTETIK
ncbi:hypothetical protein K502DRAFT_361521, partial [Neoconidiobolus thromboides FSU 785]